jgi:hypothetical protein
MILPITSIHMTRNSQPGAELLIQEVRLAFSLALERAGKSMPAKIAMMAITTNNSIRVNAFCLVFIYNNRDVNPPA